MTKDEFERANRVARRNASTYTLMSLKRAHETYRSAAEQARLKLLVSLDSEASELTQDKWISIATQLQDIANSISSQIDTALRANVPKAVDGFIQPNIKHMTDHMVGIKDINKVSIEAIGVAINTRVVDDMIKRMEEFTTSYSDRIWKLKDAWMDDVKSIVTVGMAQGLSPAKIAKSLTDYTKDGKVALAKRWGALSADAKDIAKRIPNNIDYRALRLVRSEMYASIQNAQAQAGKDNPGCNGLYDWKRNPGAIHDCKECEDYASNSPYEYDKIPDYPHPNCMCAVEPQLRNRDEFVNDLIDWGNGKSIDYLDDWYNSTYMSNMKGSTAEEPKKDDGVFKRATPEKVMTFMENELDGNENALKCFKAFYKESASSDDRFIIETLFEEGHTPGFKNVNPSKSAQYDFDNNKMFLRINIEQDGVYNPVAHEFGHYADFQLAKLLKIEHSLSNQVYSNKHLMEAIRDDWQLFNSKHADNIIGKINTMTSSEHTGITDIFSSFLSKSEVGALKRGVGYHEYEYWQEDITRRQYECFASMFEAGNTLSMRKAFEDYLPNAWKWYGEMKEDILRRLKYENQ